MKTLITPALFAAAALGLALPALADGHRHDRDGRGYHRNYHRGDDRGVNLRFVTPLYIGASDYYRHPRYASSTTYVGNVRYLDERYVDDRAVEYDEARVVAVDPLLREVRREVPVRECYDEARPVGRYDSRSGTAGGTVLGGLIGGVVGNQIGKGDGRRVATVAGAILGAAVGHDIAEQRRDAAGTAAPRGREELVERCELRYETQREQRIDGYRVTYEYQGRTYQTRLAYDPGATLRIRVAVAPAER